MKKILLLILLFAGLITKAQFPNTITGGNSSTLNKQLGAYGANLGYVWTAAYSDTTAANLSFIKNVPGIVIRIGNDLWMRSANILVWIKISGGSQNLQQVTHVGNLTDTVIKAPEFNVTYLGNQYAQLSYGNFAGNLHGALNLLSPATNFNLSLFPTLGFTNDRTQKFQDKDGTIALLSDISDSIAGIGTPTIAGFSVLGRSGDVSGTGVDITAANNEDVLFKNGDTLQFNQPNLVKRQGNVIGDILYKTSLIDTVGLTGGIYGGATYTISGSKLRVQVTGDISWVRYDSLTSLDVIQFESVVSFNTFSSTTYEAQFGIHNIGYPDPGAARYSIYGTLSTRSDNGTLGRMYIVSRDATGAGTTLATSASDLSMSTGDSILVKFEKYENTVTFSTRNLTTNSAWVRVTYTLVGTETSHSVGSVGIVTATEDYYIHQFKVSSRQIKNPTVYLFGDSKFTKSTYQNESLAALLKNNYGTVYANCAVGSTSADLVANMWEVINLVQPTKVVISVSNDIRFGVSSGTWQANLTTLYDGFTAAGIDVYFASFYETSSSQSAMDTWLLSNYPTKYIRRAYTALAGETGVLSADNIHLNAYGNKVAYEAIVLDGKLENEGNKFRELKFRTGDTDFPAAGDSVIRNTYFGSAYKLNVFREGDIQWEVSTYEANSITRNIDTIFFHPPLDVGERIIIQSYPITNWVDIVHDPLDPVPVCVVFTTAGDLTESPSCTWSSAAGTGKGYSTTTLASGDDGYFLIKNTDGSNTDLNPIGLDDDGDNTEDYTAWEYCIYRNTFINEYSYQNNGSSGSSGVAAAANDWLRLRKEGAVVYAEKSTNSGVTWTLVYTFSGSAAHTLYAKTHLVVSGKKIIDAKVLNFH